MAAERNLTVADLPEMAGENFWKSDREKLPTQAAPEETVTSRAVQIRQQPEFRIFTN